VGVNVNIKVVESAYGQSKTCPVTLSAAYQTTYRVTERGTPPNSLKHVSPMSLRCDGLTP
jgi:hypothetical protein